MNTNFNISKEDLINKINKANDEFFGTGEPIELTEVEQMFYELFNERSNFETHAKFYSLSHDINVEHVVKHRMDEYRKRNNRIDEFTVFKLEQGKISASEIPYETPVFVISSSQGIIAFTDLIDEKQFTEEFGNSYFVDGHKRTLEKGYYLSNDCIIYDHDERSIYIRPTDEELEAFVDKFLEIIPENFNEIYDRRDCLRRLFNIESYRGYNVDLDKED